MEPLEWYRIVAPLVACAGLGVAAAWGNPRLRFAVLGMAAVVGYAVLQDQVSARLCPEYFTVFHPPVPGLTDPTLLGVAWGFLGGWWGGLLLGYAAGLTATLGPRPKLAPRDLVRPLLVLLLVVTTAVALTGFAVWRHAEVLDVSLGRIADPVPADRRRWLLVVACYHFVAYAASAAGGVVLCLWVRAERVRRQRTGEGERRPDNPGDTAPGVG